MLFARWCSRLCLFAPFLIGRIQPRPGLVDFCRIRPGAVVDLFFFPSFILVSLLFPFGRVRVSEKEFYLSSWCLLRPRLGQFWRLRQRGWVACRRRCRGAGANWRIPAVRHPRLAVEGRHAAPQRQQTAWQTVFRSAFEMHSVGMQRLVTGGSRGVLVCNGASRKVRLPTGHVKCPPSHQWRTKRQPPLPATTAQALETRAGHSMVSASRPCRRDTVVHEKCRSPRTRSVETG